ncbi:MAG: hypothetical protein J6I76_05895 [Oribacterium sp.]|nr:hypothetical protein [Oribacterium sp.]
MSNNEKILKEAKRMEVIGNLDKAEQLYLSLLQGKEQIQAMHELGNLLYSQDRTESAIEWLRRAALFFASPFCIKLQSKNVGCCNPFL